MESCGDREFKRPRSLSREERGERESEKRGSWRYQERATLWVALKRENKDH
jgi:hypothetical protein